MPWERKGFGEYVKRVRKGRGLTMLSVAQAIGCKGAGVGWKLEVGERGPFLHPEQVRGLAEVLGVEPAELMREAGYDFVICTHQEIVGEP